MKIEPTYLESFERYGVDTANTQACMRGYEYWPERIEKDGIVLTGCPCMGPMAISPAFGHPVSVAQARREKREIETGSSFWHP